MSTLFGRAVASTRSPGAGYRTLWRWHFYAGLFVMPFLVILAITGTLYCFQPQIEPLLYPHRLVVTPRAEPRLGTDVLLRRAATAVPPGARALTIEVRREPARSAEFVFRLPGGSRQSVYVDPYSGALLGTLDVDGRFMQVDRMLHRKLLLGKPGELLMELVACWTLVMIGTGIALWWPSRRPGHADDGHAPGRRRDAFVPDWRLRGRPLWKSVHAALGIWLAAGALAFVLSGLPWTGSWGQQFKAFASKVRLGAPPGAWGDPTLRSAPPGSGGGTGAHAPAGAQTDTAHGSSPAAAVHHADDAMPGMVMDDLPLPQTPWAVGRMAVPDSAPAPAVPALTPDVVIAKLAALGLASGYSLALPATPEGVYTASYFPADPKAERTLYLDQYSGRVLRDVGYADYGAIAQAVSYGTSLHMGRYFGLANQLVCAAISLGLAAMAVTGFVMWWKRRPALTLGAPARERRPPPMRGWVAGLVLLGCVFPLMGATLLVVWAADRLLFGRAMRRTA